MRIALFSDIHGNYTGLSAVLTAIDAYGGVDLKIAAGDHITGGSGGDDVLELLQHHQVNLIRGDSDTEEKLIRLGKKAKEKPGSTRNEFEYYRDMQTWFAEHVSSSNRVMLASLPKEMLINVAPDRRLYVCHASPRATNDLTCSPTTDPGVVREVYGVIDAEVIAFGHWHESYNRWLDNRLYINVGSIGFRQDGLSRFTIITYQDMDWVVEQDAVPYDVDAEEYRMKQRLVPRVKL